MQPISPFDATPRDPMEALILHLRLFDEARRVGDVQQGLRRQAGVISAHAYLHHRAAMGDCDRILRGLWGARGIITAYSQAAALTPAIDLGLQGPGVAARLRDRGVIDPHAVWRAPLARLAIPDPDNSTGS